MAPFRSSIETFLKSARSILSSPANTRPRPLTIVVGNQSADLDSIISALVLAYTLQSTTRRRTYIPITNLEPSDIPLRPELGLALSRAKIQPSDLITVPELHKLFFSGEGRKEEGTKWLLVDHNKLELPFSNPPWKVAQEDIIGCVDHHNDENYIRSTTGSGSEGLDMRIIQKSGSCMSLVVNYAREIGNWVDTGPLNLELTSSEEIGSSNLEFEAQTALIALAPILIDTGNIKESSKTTETDLEAVSFLEGKIAAWETARNNQNSETEPYIRDAYFKELDTAKSHLEPLTLQQILQKDYKEWEDENGRRVGISAVVKSFEWMVEKGQSETSNRKISDGRNDGLKEFWDAASLFVESRVDGPADSGERKGLDIYSIMTTSPDETDGKRKKQLLVSPISEIGKEALSSFEESYTERFDLEPMSNWEVYEQGERGLAGMSKVWRQKNTAPSRKEVGPALREALQSLNT